MVTKELIIDWLKIILALPVVLLLAFISLKLSKSYMKTINKSRHIQVIETVPIYHKSALSIVQVGKKYYVLSVSEHSISKISELTSEEIKEIQQAQEIKWKTNQLTNWAEKIKGITK